MFFELDDILVDAILSAMEDQQQLYALNSTNLEIVEGSEADEEDIYMLPFWSGEDGFKVLKDFTSSLKNLKIREELKFILLEGRGVFRNFKNKLKQYPEIEHSFYIFKDNAMKKVVQEWYNSLREEWGLERLDLIKEDCDDLVLEDFIFDEYNYQNDYDCITTFVSEEAKKFERELPQQFAQYASSLWKSQFNFNSGDDVNGFVCRTLAQEFVGCVLFSSIQSSFDKSAVLNGLLVIENYRGLGIAKTLLDKSISSLQKKGFQWLLIATNFIPQLLEPLFEKQGFRKFGNVYAADLTKV